MKSLDRTVKEVMGLIEAKSYGAGELYWDDPKFDPNNPTVAIRGYGTMTTETLENAVGRDLEDLVKRVKSGRLDIVANHFLLDDKSAFMYKVKAYMDATAEMQNPKVKRKLTILKKKM